MRLLLIEDDLDLCYTLHSVLKKEGFILDECHNGADGLCLLKNNQYSAVILDRMIPEIDGLTLLRQAREQGVTAPVLMLTAMGRVTDRVDGLDAGADDYLTKPFDTRELIARLRALTRRSAGELLLEQTIACGDISLSSSEQTLTGPKGTVSLSRKEYDLLEYLCQRADKLQARVSILGAVWGTTNYVEEGNLDTYIHFVRRRLATVGSTVTIVTVRGTGYRLSTSGD